MGKASIAGATEGGTGTAQRSRAVQRPRSVDAAFGVTDSAQEEVTRGNDQGARDRRTSEPNHCVVPHAGSSSERGGQKHSDDGDQRVAKRCWQQQPSPVRLEQKAEKEYCARARVHSVRRVHMQPQRPKQGQDFHQPVGGVCRCGEMTAPPSRRTAVDVRLDCVAPFRQRGDDRVQ